MLLRDDGRSSQRDGMATRRMLLRDDEWSPQRNRTTTRRDDETSPRGPATLLQDDEKSLQCRWMDVGRRGMAPSAEGSAARRSGQPAMRTGWMAPSAEGGAARRSGQPVMRTGRTMRHGQERTGAGRPAMWRCLWPAAHKSACSTAARARSGGCRVDVEGANQHGAWRGTCCSRWHLRWRHQIYRGCPR